MTTEITPNTEFAQDKLNFLELVKDKVDQRITAIDVDIIDIDDGITAAEMVPIIRRMLVSEKKLLRVLPKILRLLGEDDGS